MPDRATLAKIHIAAKELNLTVTQYEDIIFQCAGKTSAKDITDHQAAEVIAHFRRLGWKPRKKKTGAALRFEGLGHRPGMASPAQLRKIEATWNTHPGVHTQTEEALRRFIAGRFKIDSLRFIESRDVGKILKAIQSLQ